MSTLSKQKHAPILKPGSPVTIRDDRTGYQYPGRMHSCGKRGGVYLESNYAPRPGSTMHIRYDTPEPAGAGKGGCRGVIRWRRSLLSLSSAWSYGLGIQCTN
jgi:hypothetical protein